MNAMIESTLQDLLHEFATSMASEGEPRRDRMMAKLNKLVDEAQAMERRCIVLAIKALEKNR